MKKIVALAMAGMMVLSMAACGQSETQENKDTANEIVSSDVQEENDAPVSGAYERTESPVVTDEFKALFEKALQGMDGAEYTPVAYIASQVVAGTNHLVLCRIAPVTPDAEETYALVILYEDLEGNAEITDILESTATAGEPDLAGGWNEPESPVVTDEARDALSKAVETMDGAEYTPVALVAEQIVAGTNYCILCEIEAVTPDSEAEYHLVYVYADLEGNAEITDVVSFGAGE